MKYKSIKEIRRENFANIVNTQFSKRRSELAEKLNLQVGLISRMLSNKDIGDAMARKIEEAAGKEINWLDNIHREQEFAEAVRIAAIELIRQAAAKTEETQEDQDEVIPPRGQPRQGDIFYEEQLPLLDRKSARRTK